MIKFDKFTVKAQEAIGEAQQIATSYNHQEIKSEHLLLALVNQKGGVIPSILQKLEVNSEELNKYNRFVTFSHLPYYAKIRIFNLAGVLVQTIEKEDDGQFERWNLANEEGLPVASGLYIAYLELRTADGVDLGTKILKVAIIQEQQILDRF